MGSVDERASPLLRAFGRCVREQRAQRRLTRRELASRCGLSERFLAQVETGRGNPSLTTLSALAAGLQLPVATLLGSAAKTQTVALLGLRGAGKTTLGRALADKLGASFVELDARVEEAAGLSLREMFELHGEDYYRRFERDVLERLLAQGSPMVLATGGGIVAHQETFELLRRHAITMWLRATPEEHWQRVVAQGDHRPMANDPLAMAHLRELLARREDLYSTADVTVSTSGRTAADVLHEATAALARHETPRPA